MSFLFSAGGAMAALFMVTNLADSGPGSLRQAVLDANAASGADEIAFTPGLAGTITLTSNEIEISDSLVVHGPGHDVLLVSGNDQFRVFYIENPSVSAPIDVTLESLRVTQGLAFPSHGFSFGGGVFSNGENLTIRDSWITDSHAGFLTDPPDDGCGGNVALSGSSAATLRIVNSLVAGGGVTGLGSQVGGNLCVLSGKLLLEGSTVSDGNAPGGFGGGLYAQSLAAGSSISFSAISYNFSDLGGGIASDSFGARGDLTIESSTISNNSVSNFGPGGGIFTRNDDLRILGSTIWANNADRGGGIASEDSHLQIVNSTISGNNSERLGGGIDFSETGNGSLLLRLSTVTANRTVQGGGSLVVASPSTTGAVQLDHSIVANGTPVDLAGFGALSVTLTANYSLIEAPGSAVLVGGNNRIGVDPLLGPLASNGGLTQTHALLPGSPASDAGNPAIPNPPATDQRGSQRIVGSAVDLGSVEGGSVVEIPTLSTVGWLALSALLLVAGTRKLLRS